MYNLTMPRSPPFALIYEEELKSPICYHCKTFYGRYGAYSANEEYGGYDRYDGYGNYGRYYPPYYYGGYDVY